MKTVACIDSPCVGYSDFADGSLQHKTSSELGRHASCRVRSVSKSWRRVSFGLKKFGPEAFFIDFLVELDNLTTIILFYL